MLCFGPFPALLLSRFFFVLWLLCFMLGRAFHGALVLGQSLMLEQLPRILPVCANMTYPDGYGERKLESLPPLGLSPEGQHPVVTCHRRFNKYPGVISKKRVDPQF